MEPQTSFDQRLQCQPMRAPDGAQHFGLEITGFDLTTGNRAQQHAIVQQWSDEPLVLIRNQLVGEQDLMAFSRLFGELEVVVRKDIHSPYHPEIAFISNLYLKDGSNIGGLGDYEVRWHSDQSYRKRPATGAVFFAIEVPPSGGNTRWIDMRMAYRALPAQTRALIDDRHGLYAYEMYDTDITESDQVEDIRERTPDARHPLVLRHPRSGEASLYFDPTQTYAIDGLDAETSADLVNTLTEHVSQPAFVQEHQWRLGDVMLWDNARLLHSRTDFDVSHPRLAKRTTVFLNPEYFPVPHGG